MSSPSPPSAPSSSSPSASSSSSAETSKVVTITQENEADAVPETATVPPPKESPQKSQRRDPPPLSPRRDKEASVNPPLPTTEAPSQTPLLTRSKVSSSSSKGTHIPIPDKYTQVDIAQQFGNALKTYYEKEVKDSHATQNQRDSYLEMVRKSVKDSFIKHWTKNTRIMSDAERDSQVPVVEKPADESLQGRILELKKVAAEKAQRVMQYRQQYPHKMEQVTQLHEAYTQEVGDIYSRILDVDSERSKTLRDQCESASLSTEVEAPRSNLDELLNRFIKDGALVNDQMLVARHKLEHTMTAMQTILNNNGGSSSGSGSGVVKRVDNNKRAEKRSLIETEEEREEDANTSIAKRKRQRRSKKTKQ